MELAGTDAMLAYCRRYLSGKHRVRRRDRGDDAWESDAAEGKQRDDGYEERCPKQRYRRRAQQSREGRVVSGS